MIKSSNAILILRDGSYFYGQLLGKHDGQQGEICFNTGMTGYQEVISDPSYANQIIAFSFPHIGNVGTNVDDNEAEKAYLNGIILGELPTYSTNHRHESDFLTWLQKRGVGGIYGIDTRSLIKKIAASQIPIKGIIKSFKTTFDKEMLKACLKNFEHMETLSGSNLSHIMSTRVIYNWDKPEWPLCQISRNIISPKIGVLDFGLKENILRCLTSRSCSVQVFPENISYHTLVKEGIQGIVLSNGPGDPREMNKKTLQTIQQLIEAGIPILGICLGYQLIAYLYNANIFQMACGHHGINHPVKDLETSKTLITSQNHEFVVDLKTLPKHLEPTHISLFDHSLEGFRVKDKPIIAVQFHPEASPGPHDAKYIFDHFINLVETYAQKNRH